MSLAEKYCLTAAFVFFLTGLLTGIWKYVQMGRNREAVAPVYVDIAHRSSLMYSFAAILLGQMAAVSRFSAEVNAWAALVTLAFFAFAIGSYVLHGWLRDTDNQFRHPQMLGRWTLPKGALALAMLLLIAAEVGGTLVLGVGALLNIWGAAP